MIAHSRFAAKISRQPDEVPSPGDNQFRQGYVSLAAAAESYGVVLDAGTLEVDRAATDQRRRQK